MTARPILLTLICLTAINFSACKKEASTASGAPPAAQVIKTGDPSLVTVDHADQFAVTSAEQVETSSQLQSTGSIYPDVSREVPVISLANGRVVDIKARLDDHVRKGELLMKVQSPDVATAFDVYMKASNDERTAGLAYARAKSLYAHGAIAESSLEQTEGTAKDALADLNAAEEQLRILGVDKHHPSSAVNVYSPISGVIVAQNVTQAAAAGVNLSGSATAFTVVDLSTVWAICDVYENDIPKLQLGQSAKIHLNAYPDRTLTGRISDIGPVLDPNIRTAKVRIELANPGILRLGMFVTATFESKQRNTIAVVPASAILHLHDRNWAYLPVGNHQFKRVQVSAGEMLPGNKQQILAGIQPGQQVVANVAQLEATLEAQ
jgi:cobalt-zinc-cadmium efflux system membrane fusion protein